MEKAVTKVLSFIDARHVDPFNTQHMRHEADELKKSQVGTVQHTGDD